jgi:hypothetical protein
VYAFGARDGLRGDQTCRCDGSSDPDGQIGEDVPGRMRHPDGLPSRGCQGHARRRRQRKRPVAPKLRASRHLLSQAADVAERFVEVVHRVNFVMQSNSQIHVCQLVAKG